MLQASNPTSFVLHELESNLLLIALYFVCSFFLYDIELELYCIEEYNYVVYSTIKILYPLARGASFVPVPRVVYASQEGLTEVLCSLSINSTKGGFVKFGTTRWRADEIANNGQALYDMEEHAAVDLNKNIHIVEL